MPEWVRSITLRLREFVGNRRRAPRYQARLPISVSLLDARRGAETDVSTSPALTGHTRDLSESGIGIIVQSIHVGGHYLMGEGRLLRISLELSDGALILHALPVRYEQLERTDAQTGYLIGASIKTISDQDRARLIAYLKQLNH